MNRLFMTANGEDFVIVFEKQYDTRFIGKAIEVQYYTTAGSGEIGFEYRSNKSSDSTNDINEARVWFEWSFCWRGVWEGRVYFKDDEYWSEEMKTISDLWDQIEIMFKQKIKSENPEYKWFDE